MSSVEGSVSGGGAWALKAGAALSSEVFSGSLGLRVRTGAPYSAADITGSFEVFSTPIGGISITGSNNGNAWTSFGVQLGGGVTRTGTHSRVNVQQAIAGAEACFGSACKPPGK